jgi:hypothetical protein
MTKVDATGITAQEDSIFKAQWELYQAVLDGDHLEHTKLYINLVEYLHCHLQVRRHRTLLVVVITQLPSVLPAPLLLIDKIELHQ